MDGDDALTGAKDPHQLVEITNSYYEERLSVGAEDPQAGDLYMTAVCRVSALCLCIVAIYQTDCLLNSLQRRVCRR